MGMGMGMGWYSNASNDYNVVLAARQIGDKGTHPSTFCFCPRGFPLDSFPVTFDHSRTSSKSNPAARATDGHKARKEPEVAAQSSLISRVLVSADTNLCNPTT